MINEPEQKAVVLFRKGTEDLIISPSYQGPTSDFAWVVPVPARPKVEILKGAIFHELAALTMPAPPKGPYSADGHVSRNSGVKVLERKTVGAYDVSVLSATDGKALVNWLKANNYHVPKQVLGPVNSYVKQGWTFVACRIKAPKVSKGLHTGTLAPLRLTFAAKNPVYPMKLSSANPKPFNVLVYLLIPSNQAPGSHNSIGRVSGPDTTGAAYWRAVLRKDQDTCPTAAKLCRDEMQVYVQDCRSLSPGLCKSDFVWNLPLRNLPQRRIPKPARKSDLRLLRRS
jgi:hypothetical protein